jgi:citrate lyase subunit beta/citryl-CoA lyase
MMRRSLLFIPGNNPSMIQTGALFSPDAIIFDLEDAVAPGEKDSARELVFSFLKEKPYDNIEIIVRINDYHSDYYQDDIKMVTSSVDTLMIPKASYDDLLAIINDLEKLKLDVNLIPIIELASSLLEVEKIASLSQVNGILLGAEDLTKIVELNYFILEARLAMLLKHIKLMLLILHIRM